MRYLIAIALAVLLAAMQPVYGYTCFQSGIGPVLVSGDRVYFSQADDSLTALDLTTGAVIARTKPGTAGYALEDSPYGIVRTDSRGCALLDRQTLTAIWEAQTFSPPEVRAGKVICFDHASLLLCRDLRDGHALWSYDVPNPDSSYARDELTVGEGHVVLFHPVMGEERVVVLDSASGKQLAMITPAEGEYYLKALPGGDRVYIASGRFDDAPKGDRFLRLLTFSIDGRLLSGVQTPSNVASEPYFGQRVVVDGLEFGHDGVRPATTRPAVEYPAREYRWGNYAVMISRTQKQPTVMVVTVRNQDGSSWRGFLPYLDPAGTAYASLHGNRLLLASNLGHLECIDVATGRSLWLYSSPTLVRVASYSWPNGMPPRLTSQAEVFRRQNANREHLAGLCLIPETMPDDALDTAALFRDPSRVVYPTIISDPAPVAPYADIPQLVRTAWAGVLIVLLLAGIPLVFFRRRWSAAVAAVLVPLLVVGLSYWLQLVCRISDGATLCIKVTIVALLLAVPLCAMRAIPARRPWGLLAAGIGVVASAGWCYHILTLLRYG